MLTIDYQSIRRKYIEIADIFEQFCQQYHRIEQKNIQNCLLLLKQDKNILEIVNDNLKQIVGTSEKLANITDPADLARLYLTIDQTYQVAKTIKNILL